MRFPNLPRPHWKVLEKLSAADKLENLSQTFLNNK